MRVHVGAHVDVCIGEFMHQGEIHNFPEIAERFRRRHTHFPGNSRTVPKSTKSASEYLLGCLHVDLLTGCVV